MSADYPVKKLLTALFAAGAIGTILGGCVSEGPVRSVAEAAGMATTAQEPKKFVVDSRHADATYIPVGTVATRTAKRKTVEEFKALEAQLEAKRTANDAAGAKARILGATPAPEPAAAQPTN